MTEPLLTKVRAALSEPFNDFPVEYDYLANKVSEGEQAFFRGIYVHSKLLVVDDVFSLLSSANINTRSLHTDSELGLAAPDAELSKHWREELWKLHVGKSFNDDKGRCDATKNFKKWNDVMDKNWENKNKN